MKSLLSGVIDGLMMLPHLRGIVWTVGIIFCIAIWIIGISHGVKAWELASTFFKVA
uniref:hypothetical protein n=1 Tax=Pluralibacter gergoviae TaxID=61647 RepID=UPI00147FD230|nr:hypothetical protein [Pluralibacter gergoviae]